MNGRCLDCSEWHGPDSCVVLLREERDALRKEVKALRLDRAVLETIARRPFPTMRKDGALYHADAVALARRALGLPERP